MIRLLAYAKLNLSLSVLGKRQDGFHQIESMVQNIDLADEITVDATEDSLVVENDLGIAPREDLSWLAARLLLDEKRSQRGMRICVHKSIPTGAGLGGGSSDAAAVLWAVNILTPPVIPGNQLLRLAGCLGSDVPLFLCGGRVRVKGRGEEVDAVFPCRREWFVVIVPPINCNTGQVYSRVQLKYPAEIDNAGKEAFGNNDLYGAALQLYPQLKRYGEAVADIGGAYGGMSGSGSAFYAAFDDGDKAALAHKNLEGQCPQARVFLSQGVGMGFAARGE